MTLQPLAQDTVLDVPRDQPPVRVARYERAAVSGERHGRNVGIVLPGEPVDASGWQIDEPHGTVDRADGEQVLVRMQRDGTAARRVPRDHVQVGRVELVGDVLRLARHEQAPAVAE